ncbi:ABC transporter ATP-binding protein [Coprobacillus sp. OM08-19]|uniref:ABC transporter ATP-binding protein n=1 Tax=Faecalibacillus intestinalis TaxID=1982626 RepID=UPI000E4F04A2|nr:ABC transporter ATP-binding protein [uncultured Intestinibacter sp.]RGG05719.1 ABC transporter ATP-binding protein [Coprobacillus sp. AF27-24BH]RGH50962.1 ABC transporter ATP-binding protein [Coprobacillus sp. AM37-9BH]RGI24559.1 ABC transporter ATP-binding protein [Coprobacillus sp. OM08-19]RHQ19948.1 ABC transporter ATP-binding protein [Coprobacillus sp. AF29-3BH]
MEKVIEIKNITKIYNLYDKPTDRLKEVLFPKFSKHKEFSALKDVSFDVKKGEILGIIGKNGSGKSTILKIITNVLTPTSGEAIIKGKIAALLELGAGFNMEYTGIENIYLNGQMIGFSKEEMDEKLDDIIEFADIGDHIYQPVKTYSSGMFARLAFSVAISVDPDILIVDEALSVGDVFFQNKCYRRFDDFRRRGKTILFVTHDMGSVIKYCNRCVLLNAGKKVAEGSPQEMVDLYKKIMVGQWDERDENSEKIIDQKVEKVLEENKKLWKEQMVINPDIEAYGDGRAEIIDFGIFSTDGNIGNNVYKGDYYDVKMKVRINEDNLSPIFAFKLRDVKGSELTGTNTMLENIDTSNLKKSDIVTVTFRQKQYLQPGQYLLSLGCTAFEGDNLVVYSRNYNCCVLGVVADKGTIGVFDSESQVNIVVEE